MAASSVARRCFLGSLATIVGAGMLTVGCGSAAVQATTQSGGSLTTVSAPTTTINASIAATTTSSTTTSLAGAALAAANTTSATNRAAPVTLNWWPGWPGPYMGDIANAFMKDNPPIKNVDLAKQAGLDSTKLPETWDDVLLWHQKLTKIDASGNVLSLGLDPLFSRPSAASGGDPWMWPSMWGFHYFDVNTMKYDIDRSETADFYTMIQKIDDVAGVDKKAAFLKPFSNKYGAFGAGKQAMDLSKFAPDVQQGIQFFTNSLDQAHEVWIPDMDPEDGYLRTQWQKVADQVNHHKLDPKAAAQQLQFMMTTQIKSQAGDFKA